MHEIITILIGQCGTCVGLNYWERLADEHGLNCRGNFAGTSPLQLEKIGVCFDESSSGRYVPRTVFADMDSTAVSALSASQCSDLFPPDCLVDGPGEAASNFGRGHESKGAHATADAVLAAVQRQLERSDRVRAVHIVHSLGGGTGSGLTSRLLQHGLGGIPVHTFSLFPGHPAVVEAYNAVLCAPHLSSHAEVTYCWDMAGLRAASGVPRPDIEHVNQTAASMMLGLTACVRFPGQQNLSPGKLASALVPLPRLHFLVPSLAYGSRHGNSARELAARMLSTDSQLVSCDSPGALHSSGGSVESINRIGAGNGHHSSGPDRILSAAGIFRGRVPMQALDAALSDLRLRRESAFPDWLTHAFSVGVCDIPPRGESLSAAFFVNTTAASRLISQQTRQVRKLFASGRAFFHLYQQEGVTETDMLDALDECDRLCKLYEEAAGASGTGASRPGATGTGASRPGATGTGASRSGATGTVATGTVATGTGASGTGASGNTSANATVIDASGTGAPRTSRIGASETGASGTGASGTSATGTGATGTDASGTGAYGTGASGTGASGTSASGTGASGTGAPRTSTSGTGAPGTSATGIGASGISASGIGASRIGASGTGAPRASASGMGTPGAGALGIRSG